MRYNVAISREPNCGVIGRHRQGVSEHEVIRLLLDAFAEPELLRFEVWPVRPIEPNESLARAASSPTRSPPERRRGPTMENGEAMDISRGYRMAIEGLVECERCAANVREFFRDAEDTQYIVCGGCIANANRFVRGVPVDMLAKLPKLVDILHWAQIVCPIAYQGERTRPLPSKADMERVHETTAQLQKAGVL